ncbi:MAG: hypothetical protein LAP61_26870 [Acidobacteriia bacterium]|nr:hypothetical protein [Terriglobia bacterium]
MIGKLGVVLSAMASLCAAADTLWEPATVVAVEQVSTPAKEPDASCRSLPKGATPPARCRPSALRAEQFWRVTVDVGNKRFVVRPYRSAKLLDALNQDATDYVDPHLTPGAPIEGAVVSSKTIRLRTDQGAGIPAIVDSQELLSTIQVTSKPESAPPPRPQAFAAWAPSSDKVVLLENSDFLDLETQEIKSQDIGDGAVLYSFAGASSPVRVASNKPVFLVMAESESASGGNMELSRLQVGQGARQMPYSLTRNRSASSLPITVTQPSVTLRKVNVRDPLPPGEYVILVENSNRGFLFEVR